MSLDKKFGIKFTSDTYMNLIGEKILDFSGENVYARDFTFELKLQCELRLKY